MSLLSWVARLYSQCHGAEVREWCNTQAGEWGDAVRGRSALLAAAARLILDETVQAPGLTAVTTLWGLHRFYDSLGLEKVADAAVALGYRRCMVALLAQLYASPRILRERLATRPDSCVERGPPPCGGGTAPPGSLGRPRPLLHNPERSLSSLGACRGPAARLRAPQS